MYISQTTNARRMRNIRSDDVLQSVEEDVALREHANRLRRPESHGER
jgi:hypothetical protein